MTKYKITVNKDAYKTQLDAIATAMSEMDDSSPESFQKFIDRMQNLHVLYVIPEI